MHSPWFCLLLLIGLSSCGSDLERLPPSSKAVTEANGEYRFDTVSTQGDSVVGKPLLATVNIYEIEVLKLGENVEPDTLTLTSMKELEEQRFVDLKQKSGQSLDFYTVHPWLLNGVLELTTQTRNIRFPIANSSNSSKGRNRNTYYQGYAEDLSLYVLSYYDTVVSTGELILVDSISGKAYSIYSPFEVRAEPIVPSPDGRCFAVAINSTLAQESVLMVWELKRKGIELEFVPRFAKVLPQLLLTEVVWKGPQSLALKTSTDPIYQVQYPEHTSYYDLNLEDPQWEE